MELVHAARASGILGGGTRLSRGDHRCLRDCLPRDSQTIDERALFRRGADTIRTAVVFTTVLLAFSLGIQAATTVGAIDDPDLARRSTMVFMGLYFVLMGNALPKKLTPLSELQCDGARMQAFQRFTGWTWVLMGLSYAACWLILPLDVAKPVSVVVIVGGMLAVVTQIVRLRRMRRKEA